LCVLGLRAAADLAADARARGATELVRRADADGRRLALLAEDILTGEPGLSGLARGELARLEDRPAASIWAEAATTATLPEFDRRAYANWRHAEALLEAGAPRSQAEAVLRSAAELARRLGARGLEAEIEALALRGRISLTEASTAEEQTPATPAGLTPRELEVLRLLGHGRTNREIARTLFMSEKTASVHVTHILRKLDLKNRVQAAAVAVRLGLSSPQQPVPAAPPPHGRDR
jgi:DNA-binding CsgD family transcriptional regulator